jgi:hypothetical protein
MLGNRQHCRTFALPKINYKQFKINEPLRDCFHYDSRAV